MSHKKKTKLPRDFMLPLRRRKCQRKEENRARRGQGNGCVGNKPLWWKKQESEIGVPGDSIFPEATGLILVCWKWFSRWRWPSAAVCSLCNTDPIPDHTNIPGRSLCYFLDMGMGQGDLGWYNEHRVKAKAAPRGQTIAPFTGPSSFRLGMVLAVCRYFPAIHIFSATNLRASWNSWLYLNKFFHYLFPPSMSS